MEVAAEVARPRVRRVSVVVSRVTKKAMFLRAGSLGFKVVREAKKGFSLISARYDPLRDDVNDFCKVIFRKREDLVVGLQQCYDGSEQIEVDVVDLANAIWEHIVHWRDYLTRLELLSIFRGSVPPQEGGILIGWDNGGGTINSLLQGYDLSKISYKELREILTKIFNSKLVDMLEAVLTCALTLRQVNRQRGIYANRPVWMVVVAPPSTYKTTLLNLLRRSRYTFFVNQFTGASLLSAKPDVQPLIDFINGKAFIIPTLTEVASDKERALKVFAALESVYDGHYGKGTGMSGFQEREVDTVVVAAVTPAIWVNLVEYLQNIGNRWLVYQLELTDDEALSIQDRLERYRGITEVLTPIVSSFLDKLLDEVNDRMLASVQLTEAQINDLKLMAKLVARLRASTKILTYWEEKDGKRIPTKELEVIQREAPGRALNALRNFVKANTIVRGSSVDTVVGLPVVSQHSMQLAFKLALGSTDPDLTNIYLYLVKHLDREPTPSIREIARAVGLSKTTVERKLKALKHPKIGLINEGNSPKREFAEIVLKYLKEVGEDD